MLATRLPPFAERRPSVRRAVDWAFVLHADQRRDVDRAPFVVHPLEVAALLSGRGYDDDVVAAGVLHDIVEDTSATVDDVARRFGVRVAAIVAAVTEDPSIADYEARKAALRDQVAAAGGGACLVYAADKVTKVRELRAKAAREPVDSTGSRTTARASTCSAPPRRGSRSWTSSSSSCGRSTSCRRPWAAARRR